MLAAARDEAAAKVLDGDPGRGVSDGSNLKIMEKKHKNFAPYFKGEKNSRLGLYSTYSF